MNFTKSTQFLVENQLFVSCSCLSCPCNGKATGDGKSSKTADGASGTQNSADKSNRLNNSSGCS